MYIYIYITKSIVVSTDSTQVWVSAHVSADWINRHGGKRSVVEVLSSVFTVFDDDMFAIPKPLKRLDKIAWTLSDQFGQVETEAGMVIVRDDTYHRVSATRLLSLATDLLQTLFVRQVVMQTARFHIDQITKHDRPYYDARSLQARGLAEHDAFVGESLNAKWHEMHTIMSHAEITTAMVEANYVAWCIEDGGLADCTYYSSKENMAWLLSIGAEAAEQPIFWPMIVDPAEYIYNFSLGPFSSIFAKKCARIMSAYKFAETNHYTTPAEHMRVVESLARAKTSAP